MAPVITPFVLSLLLSLLSVSLSGKELRYSIGPVCECSGTPAPLGDEIKTCYRRCLIEPEPKGRTTVSIHQTIEATSGPQVVECTKVIQEQSFDRSWTFSDVASPIIYRLGQISDSECRKAITDNCPTLECNHREKDDLPAEYHYASTTKVIRETISLVSMPSSVMVHEGKIKISPLSTDRLFSVEDKSGSADNKIYIWKDDLNNKNCPFQAAQSYGCDVYVDPNSDKYYMCSGGRFSITPAKGETDLASSLCPGLKMSNEGFLYTTGDTLGSDQDKHSRLFITQNSGVTGDLDYLRHKIVQVATHLDSEICNNQCEILSLEYRVSRAAKTVVRVGMTYFLMDINGEAVKCNTLSGCKLAKPLIVCGNPPRVGVTCSGVSGLWNPLLPYIEIGGSCLKPDKIEKLSFLLGSDSYVVDDDLIIKSNKSIAHGVFPTSFSNFHQGGIQMTTVDLKALKADWLRAKDAERGISRDEKVSTKLHSPAIKIGGQVMGWFSSFSLSVSNVEHLIGILTVSITVLSSLAMLVKVVTLIKADTTKTARYATAARGSPSMHSSEEMARWI